MEQKASFSIQEHVPTVQTLIQTLTNAVRADLWPGALVGLSWGLRGLPENTRISGPGGHTAAAQVETSLSQPDKTTAEAASVSWIRHKH